MEKQRTKNLPGNFKHFETWLKDFPYLILHILTQCTKQTENYDICMPKEVFFFFLNDTKGCINAVSMLTKHSLEKQSLERQTSISFSSQKKKKKCSNK